MITVFYLHGFASSPKSRKADYLRKYLSRYNVEFKTPDLNVPSYEHITLTAQIECLSKEIKNAADGDVYIIASSMGALCALHLMSNANQAITRRVKGLMFLAPSFDFIESRRDILGADKIMEWQKQGSLSVYHYSLGKNVKVSSDLINDILKYDSYKVNIKVPITIIHGKQDKEVSYEQSIQFSQHRNNVSLLIVDSDHSLSSEKQLIWSSIVKELKLFNRYKNNTGILIEEFNMSATIDNNKFKVFHDKFFSILKESYSPYFGDDAHKKRISHSKVFLAFLGSAIPENLVGGSYSKANGKLSALAVLPGYRLQGIGKSLMCHSLKCFDRKYAEVIPNNSVARKLMLSLGFNEVSNENELLNLIEHLNVKFISMREEQAH